MYPVATDFHTLAIQDTPKTRIRVYFIGAGVDCTDDNDVQTNGVLLVRELSDTDSNRRISEDGGVVFNDLFNTEVNIEVGATISKQVQMALLNLDGALSGFGFGRCKIYLDVYDAANTTWLPCPMGVYIIEMPTKTNTRIVIASGFDQMQYLNTIADAWWNNIDWTNGVTVSDLITGIATETGVSVSANLSTNILNGTQAYTEPPFTANQTTYRDILAYLGGVTGTIAYFDRDGALDMRWFKYAQIDNLTYTVDADTVGNRCMSIDIAEYAVTAIDMLEILPYDTNLATSIGSGGNVYQIAGNPFFIGADAAAVETIATPVFNRLQTVAPYYPMTLRLIADWSFESGDVINLLLNTNTIILPIMQQKLSWRGGFVMAEIQSSGEATRQPLDGTDRTAYQDGVLMHEFENVANMLRSQIQDLSGNYSLIQQTINAIENTVSAQGVTIQNILDPTGEIWTAITTNSTDLTALEAALNGEITERKSYIRFIPAEPAIVLGVDTGNEIKLKLVNNIIYFFNGDDDSTDLSLAYAYFNNEEAGADRFVAKDSVQIGNSGTLWQWKKLDNGDLVLDMV